MSEFIFGLGIGLIVGSGCTWMYYDWKLQRYDFNRKLDRFEKAVRTDESRKRERGQ